MKKFSWLWLSLLIPASVSLGCGSDKEDETGHIDDDNETETSTVTTGTTTSGTSDPDAPQILNADAWCYLHKTGDKYYQWALTAEITDPQGTETIPGLLMDAVTVVFNGTDFASYPLTCADDGDCIGSFKEADDGVACGNAAAYTIRFVVTDEDDNASAPYEVEGREGSSPAG